MRQMVHPDRILDERGIGDLPAVEAVYGLTEGLSSRMVGKFVGAALERVPALPEWQDRPGSSATASRPSARRCAGCIARPSAPSLPEEALAKTAARGAARL